MTTTINQDATPNELHQMVKFVSAEGIEEVLKSLDIDLASLQDVHRNGDYVKLHFVMDIFLDVRNKIKSLVEDDDN